MKTDRSGATARLLAESFPNETSLPSSEAASPRYQPPLHDSEPKSVPEADMNDEQMSYHVQQSESRCSGSIDETILKEYVMSSEEEKKE